MRVFSVFRDIDYCGTFKTFITCCLTAVIQITRCRLKFFMIFDDFVVLDWSHAIFKDDNGVVGTGAVAVFINREVRLDLLREVLKKCRKLGMHSFIGWRSCAPWQFQFTQKAENSFWIVILAALHLWHNKRYHRIVSTQCWHGCAVKTWLHVRKLNCWVVGSKRVQKKCWKVNIIRLLFVLWLCKVRWLVIFITFCSCSSRPLGCSWRWFQSIQNVLEKLLQRSSSRCFIRSYGFDWWWGWMGAAWWKAQKNSDANQREMHRWTVDGFFLSSESDEILFHNRDNFSELIFALWFFTNFQSRLQLRLKCWDFFSPAHTLWSERK